MRRVGWAAMTLLALAVAGYALIAGLWPTARTPFVAALFEERALRAYGHLVLGGVALAVGALQFSAHLRARHLEAHRWLGRVYVAAVVISGASAIALAPFSSGGPPAHFGFGLLGALWLGTSVAALAQVRAGRLRAHQEWMVRSYALCLAAVTLRLYLPVGIATVGFERAYPAIAWLCWVPNLLVAEWLVIPTLRRRPTAPEVRRGDLEHAGAATQL